MNWHAYLHLLVFAASTYVSNAEATECSREFRTAAESELIAPNSSVDFLQQIITSMGCKLVVIDHHTNHVRRMRLLENGDIDVMPEGSWLQERTAFANYSIPYRDEVTLLVALKSAGNQGIKQLSDVYTLNKNVLVLDFGWLGPEVQVQRELWRSNNQLIAYKDPYEGLRDLRMHRADIMLCTDLVFYQALQAPNDVQVLPFEVYREAVHLMFSKKTVSDSEVALFNTALRHWMKKQAKNKP